MRLCGETINRQEHYPACMARIIGHVAVRVLVLTLLLSLCESVFVDESWLGIRRLIKVYSGGCVAFVSILCINWGACISDKTNTVFDLILEYVGSLKYRHSWLCICPGLAAHVLRFWTRDTLRHARFAVLYNCYRHHLPPGSSNAGEKTHVQHPWRGARFISRRVSNASCQHLADCAWWNRGDHKRSFQSRSDRHLYDSARSHLFRS